MTISTADVYDNERIEVLRNTETILDTYLQIIHSAESRWDYFADINSLSIVPFAIGSLKKAMLDATRSRVTRFRFITEITKDNIPYCKEAMETVELRHLDGVKGNFGVSDTEYIAISTPTTTTTTTTAKANLTESKSKSKSKSTATIIPHAVYSNVKEDIQQQQYVFEVLWSKAIPAEDKIREIQEGIVPLRTRFLENQDEIIKELRRLNFNAKRLSVCSIFGGMQMSHKYLFDTYVKIVEEHRKGIGHGIRWIVNIEEKVSLELAKIFENKGIQIRHVKNMPPMNFGVSDKEVAVTIEKMEGGKMSQSFLISNEPLYLDHFNSIFEELWENGIDLEERRHDIEIGAGIPDIEVIKHPIKTQELYFNLVKSAKNEILLIFPSVNAFHREEKIGVMALLRKAKYGVKIRILTPADDKIRQKILTLKEQNISVRNIESASVESKFKLLVVDREASLVVETKDDSRETFAEAIGLATFSHSKPTVLPYVTIFESFWKETELNEQLKVHDRMKQEFINIAAHELRTPIQPILGLVGLLRSSKRLIEKEELDDSLNLINRNAERLKRLSEDILDVTKIESESLIINKARINLNNVISGAIQDIEENQVGNKAIKILFEPEPDVIFLDADRYRLNQVVYNLLSNAVKFTKRGGKISIGIEKKEEGDGDNGRKVVVVNIKDNGEGIDPEIFERLFDKFASKSFQGTGLGLFISRNIIEAHGGKIWAENNNKIVAGQIGATFYFTLPIANNDQY